MNVMMSVRLRLIFVFGFVTVFADNYYVKLSSDAPAMQDVEVTFQADLFDENGGRPEEQELLWVSIRP